MSTLSTSNSGARPISHGARVAFSDIAKGYGNGNRQSLALQGLSGTVAAGSFVSVVGRSGSGKSTLLRILAGLLPSDAGLIEIDNNVVEGPPSGARYVFQNYSESLFPWCSVEANIRFGLKNGSATRNSSDAGPLHYLKLVGLEDAAAKYPWQLSGGMQQRVAIARALASSPRVLLMDEPFGAVDALSRSKLQDMLLKLWEELGLTILLVTHDIDEALYLSDRILVLNPDGDGFAADVEVALPRPRSQIETREHEAFSHQRRELYQLILGQ
ncbi:MULTISPECIES: ABC transporter ATP-binding protein [Agrobacterium]|uniref:ABC transporter ATP-binding protein n=1 Tax=Agrobacterium TaxID=357 RepID=UPI0009D1A0A6|nr:MULTISPECIES: ABC transporter ATP-binding protein [Agrobacterium]WCK05839.1 ABC transporter ATP-binding protein [Agrobacterium tumefaciens]CUX71795.1 Putative ABC transporter (ATP binding protein) [Agrobacterium sp. NCPPB 925]